MIIDNASTDGTAEWLSTQNDVAFATIDDGIKGYAEVINEAIELFGIDGDILLMRPQYAITPGCISRMQEGLYSVNNIGAVGPVFNGNHLLQDRLIDYDEAVSLAEENFNMTMRQVIGLYEDIILIRREVIRKVGKFDEQFVSDTRMIKDYCLRIIEEGFWLGCITNAIAYRMLPNKTIRGYEELVIKSNEEKKMKEKWGMNYFNKMHNPNLIQRITHDTDCAIEVLEVGCDCGATLLEIKNLYPNARIYGYEINPQAARIASRVAEVEVGNLEEQNFSYKKEKFDYIIFGDVLEHLRDPETAIRYCQDYLKPEGNLIASIPNLMHVSVIKDLIAGNFTYSEAGLLDKTHIHMFTYNEIVRMFENCDYAISEIVSYALYLKEEDKQYIHRLLDLEPEAESFMFETFQYILRAGKNNNRKSL